MVRLLDPPRPGLGRRNRREPGVADLILLLVSAGFISSDYCYAKEMKRALERHTNNEATVIPISCAT